MPEPFEQKSINDEFRQLHFWFLAAFSLFLVVTFVYYLPLRFLYMASVEEEHERDSVRDIMEGMMGNDEHGRTALHEERDVRDGLAVNLNISPVPLAIGLPARLDFLVNWKPGNTPVGADELELKHEKLMHVIGVRSDMNEFFHIHPQPYKNVGGPVSVTLSPEDAEEYWTPERMKEAIPLFTVTHAFSKPGRYKIWSEITKDGVTHSYGHEPLDVTGEGPMEEKRVTFGRSVVVDGYEVELTIHEPVVKDVEQSLSFIIHNVAGNGVATEKYLGASMHLALIKDDLTQFVHTHPEEHNDVDEHMMDDGHMMNLIPFALAHGGVPEEEEEPTTIDDKMITFHVAFPEAGLYRAYAQFRPAGSDLPPDEALTAAFWIRVEEEAVRQVSPQTQWWMLLVASLTAIVILSFGVNKYLRVK